MTTFLGLVMAALALYLVLRYLAAAERGDKVSPLGPMFLSLVILSEALREVAS